MGNIPVNQLGPYAAAGVNKPANQEVSKFRSEMADEILYRQATVKVEFLQRVLNEPNLPADKRQAVEEDLRGAQRDLAQLQQELNAKYNVQ